MKKIVKYLVASIAMVAAVSCQKELVEEKAPVKDGDSYVFTASLKPATKTVLNIDEETGVMKSQWWAGAKGKEEFINVMDDKEINNKYASPSLAEPTDKVDFTLYEGSQFNGTEVFAVYPYHANNAYWKGDEDAIGVVAYFAETQTATAGTYDPTAPVHVAYNADITASTNLVFSNLSALLKFTVTDQFIRTITFSGLDYEQVSGSIVYKYNDGKYTVEDKGDGSYEVTLKAAEGRYFEVGKAYYLSVVPGTFEKGVQVVLNKELGEDENMKTYVHPQPVTLLAGTINDFGAFKTQGNLTWGVAEFRATTDVKDLELNEAGYFAGTVSLEAGKTYMLRASDEWYTESNYGLSFPREAVTVGKYALGTYDVEKEVSAAYGIRVAESVEYDILFSPSGKVLYLLDKGAAADEDLDLSEVETPDPVRTIKGTCGEVVMEPVKNKDGVTTGFEAVVEFAENSDNYSFAIHAGSSSFSHTFGCDEATYEFTDGATFATKVDGASITVDEPGFYYIEQNYDGSQVTVTIPETPDGAQWDFKKDGPAVFDFGYTLEDLFIYATYDEDEEMFTENLGPTPKYYKFVPTSLTEGKFYYSTDKDKVVEGEPYFTYSEFDGNSGVLNSATLSLEDVEFIKASELREIYIPTPDGAQWLYSYSYEAERMTGFDKETNTPIYETVTYEGSGCVDFGVATISYYGNDVTNAFSVAEYVEPIEDFIDGGYYAGILYRYEFVPKTPTSGVVMLTKFIEADYDNLVENPESGYLLPDGNRYDVSLIEIDADGYEIPYYDYDGSSFKFEWDSDITYECKLATEPVEILQAGTMY